MSRTLSTPPSFVSQGTKRSLRPAVVVGRHKAERFISSTSNMASDEDYASFLEKANQDPNEGVSKTQGASSGKVELKAVDKGAKVPKCLKDVTESGDAFYVSDADEPFEAVVLKLAGGGKGLPDEGMFGCLLCLSSDPRGDS